MLLHFNDLSDKEVSQFRKFIGSSYFNTYQTIIKLFVYLKTKYPEIASNDITPEKISFNVYGERRVNKVKIRKLISDFSDLFEKFLIQVEIEKDVTKRNLLLMKACRERKIEKRFRIAYNNFRKNSESTFSKNEEFYSNQSRIEMEYHYFIMNRDYRLIPKSLNDRTKSVNYQFLYEKLQNFYEIRACRLTFPVGFDIEKTFYQEIMLFVEQNYEEIKSFHPNIYLKYLCNKMFETYDDKYLNEFDAYCKKNIKRFDDELLSCYYIYSVSYHESRYSEKIGDYENSTKKLYEFYDYFYVKNSPPEYASNRNYMSISEYINVAGVGLSLKKFDWTHKFMEKNIKLVSPLYANDVYNFAKSRFYFLKGDYDKTLSHLKNISRSVPEYYYLSKFNQAIVYYELNDLNGIDYILKNLIQFCRENKKLLSDEKVRIKTFVQIMKELLKIKKSTSTDKNSDALVLKNKIDIIGPILDSEGWFNKKLQEFQ